MARSVAIHTALIVLGAMFALPFLWLVSTSLKPPAQLFKVPPEWIPRPFTWGNYTRALTFIPFFRYLGNTLYIALFNVVASLLSCSYSPDAGGGWLVVDGYRLRLIQAIDGTGHLQERHLVDRAGEEGFQRGHALIRLNGANTGLGHALLVRPG